MRDRNKKEAEQKRGRHTRTDVVEVSRPAPEAAEQKRALSCRSIRRLLTAHTFKHDDTGSKKPTQNTQKKQN